MKQLIGNNTPQFIVNTNIQRPASTESRLISLVQTFMVQQQVYIFHYGI